MKFMKYKFLGRFKIIEKKGLLGAQKVSRFLTFRGKYDRNI